MTKGIAEECSFEAAPEESNSAHASTLRWLAELMLMQHAASRDEAFACHLLTVRASEPESGP